MLRTRMLRYFPSVLTLILLGSAALPAAAGPPARAKAVPRAPRTVAPLSSAPATTPRVVFTTNLGAITLELYPDKAPVSVRNFLQYVQDKHYEGTLFHRVIPGFVIQGGGYTSTYQEKATRDPIVNESENGLKNVRGSLAVARMADPDSGTAQFYINLRDNPSLDFPQALDSGYTVFGRVSAGMDVVDRISRVPTGTKTIRVQLPGAEPEDVPMSDVPITQVVVKSVSYTIPAGSLAKLDAPAKPAQPAVAPYRDDQPRGTGTDVNALTNETQKGSADPKRMSLIWWVPEEFWRASFEDNKEFSKAQKEEFLGLVRPYLTVIVVDGTLNAEGQPKFRREAEIRAELKVRAPDGTTYTPYRSSEIGTGAKALMEAMRPILVGVLGPMGENMFVFHFPARDKNDKPVVDPHGTGSLTVSIGPREYRYRLPLASLLPHRKCSTCEEVLSGAYKFCPYDGTKLGDAN